MSANQIILQGISAADLVELFRPLLQDEVKKLQASQEERLLSPAETCKLFQPPISKTTLKSWTDKGLLTENRLGGRVWYKQSEVLEKLITLKRYKN